MKILDTPNLKFLKVGVDTDPLNNHNLEYLEKQNAIAALILNHLGNKVLFVYQHHFIDLLGGTLLFVISCVIFQRKK